MQYFINVKMMYTFGSSNLQYITLNALVPYSNILYRTLLVLISRSSAGDHSFGISLSICNFKSLTD